MYNCLIDGVAYKGVLVFDFDGVICVQGTDYPTAEPYHFAIYNINKAALAGWYIVIFTARYMKRCNSNVVRVNELGLEEGVFWLRKFNVSFNRFILGKPSADLYTDDKACRVESAKGEADWNNNFWPLVNQLEENISANLPLRL